MELDNVLELLSDKAALEAKVKELKGAKDQAEEMYKKAQAERGRLQVEKEEMELMVKQHGPALDALNKADAELSRKLEVLRKIVKLSQEL